MGWKNLEQHYKTGYIVQVTEKGICIGSGYIHDLVVLSLTGKVTHVWEFFNREKNAWLARMESEPDVVRELIEAPDKFEKSIEVFTYEGGDIVKKFCEDMCWPNITHDGQVMYENTFSTDPELVRKWATRNAKAGIEYVTSTIEDQRERLALLEARLKTHEGNLAKLTSQPPHTEG